MDRLLREMNEAGAAIADAKGLTLKELFEGRKNKSEMIGLSWRPWN